MAINPRVVLMGKRYCIVELGNIYIVRDMDTDVEYHPRATQAEAVNFIKELLVADEMGTIVGAQI